MVSVVDMLTPVVCLEFLLLCTGLEKFISLVQDVSEAGPVKKWLYSVSMILAGAHVATRYLFTKLEPSKGNGDRKDRTLAAISFLLALTHGWLLQVEGLCQKCLVAAQLEMALLCIVVIKDWSELSPKFPCAAIGSFMIAFAMKIPIAGNDSWSWRFQPLSVLPTVLEWIHVLVFGKIIFGGWDTDAPRRMKVTAAAAIGSLVIAVGICFVPKWRWSGTTLSRLLGVEAKVITSVLVHTLRSLYKMRYAVPDDLDLIQVGDLMADDEVRQAMRRRMILEAMKWSDDEDEDNSKEAV